jgi:hypothetical protein
VGAAPERRTIRGERTTLDSRDMDDRTLALLEPIIEALERIERELARANEQLADIPNALYS